MKVGFIDLGIMGRRMALNLCKHGVDLLVFDRDPAAMRILVEAGAHAATSIADVAGQVDVLFTSLPGPPEVEAVVLGPDGVVETMRTGLVLFELSTSSLELASRIDDAFRQRGCHALDAPVSGGPAGAASGDLAFWVGGDQEVFERHADLLAKMGDKAKLVGASGAGTTTKLVNNALGQMILAALAEVFSLGVKAGLDPLDLWEALKLGVPGKVSVLSLVTKQFLPGTYDVPAFSMKLGHKDVALAAALAHGLDVPVSLLDLTLAKMSEALERGLGDMDTRVHMRLQLERAGVSIAVDPDRLARALAAPKV